MLVFFNFFNNFNFIFLILSSIRVFILYFLLFLDDSNRYLSYFQDGKNHWHEEDIAVDNVERLQSEKEKERGRKGWKSGHGWSIFPRKYFDERPLSRVDFRTWDNSSYHNGGELKERWKEGSRLFPSSLIGFHVKRTNVSRLHFYIHISRPLDSFHCVKRYLPRRSPNYFPSLRHFIKYRRLKIWNLSNNWFQRDCRMVKKKKPGTRNIK